MGKLFENEKVFIVTVDTEIQVFGLFNSLTRWSLLEISGNKTQNSLNRFPTKTLSVVSAFIFVVNIKNRELMPE